MQPCKLPLLLFQLSIVGQRCDCAVTYADSAQEPCASARGHESAIEIRQHGCVCASPCCWHATDACALSPVQVGHTTVSSKSTRQSHLHNMFTTIKSIAMVLPIWMDSMISRCLGRSNSVLLSGSLLQLGIHTIIAHTCDSTRACLAACEFMTWPLLFLPACTTKMIGLHEEDAHH